MSAPDGGEEGHGEHRYVGVPEPRAPLADLVLVQPDLALGHLERFLDHPPLSGGGGQIGEGGAGQGMAQELGDLRDDFAGPPADLPRWSGGSAGGDPARPRWSGPDVGPVVLARVLGAVGARTSLEPPFGCEGPPRAGLADAAVGERQHLVLRDRQHVADLVASGQALRVRKRPWSSSARR